MRHANHRPAHCDFPFRFPTPMFSSGAQSSQLTPALRHSVNTQLRLWQTGLFFTIRTILTVAVFTSVFDAMLDAAFYSRLILYPIRNIVQMYAILFVPFKSQAFIDKYQYFSNYIFEFFFLKVNSFLNLYTCNYYTKLRNLNRYNKHWTIFFFFERTELID